MQEEGDICITISTTPLYTFLLLQATSTFPDLLHPPCNFTPSSAPIPLPLCHSTPPTQHTPFPTPPIVLWYPTLYLYPSPLLHPLCLLKTNITSLSKEASMWSLWVLSMNSFSVSAWGCGMKFNTEINNTTNKR